MNDKEERQHILGFKFDKTTNEYVRHWKKEYCFNTTNLEGIGVYTWENDHNEQEYENMNWYFKLSKC